MDETVADVGEFGLIDRLDTLIRNESLQSDRVILGIGDDTACIRCGLCAIRCPTEAMTMEKFNFIEKDVS